MDLFNSKREYIGRIERDGDKETAYDASGRQAGFSNDSGTYDGSGGYIGSPGLTTTLLDR